MKKVLLVLACLLMLVGCHNEEVSNSTIISTDYFTVEVPESWEGLYEYQIFNEEVYGYSLVLFEKESYHSMNAGHLMSISLYLDSEDYTYLPSYDYLGTLETGDKVYNVLVEYPTDVQFEQEYADEYQYLSKDMDDIIKTIMPRNGSIYKKV